MGVCSVLDLEFNFKTLNHFTMDLWPLAQAATVTTWPKRPAWGQAILSSVAWVIPAVESCALASQWRPYSNGPTGTLSHCRRLALWISSPKVGCGGSQVVEAEVRWPEWQCQAKQQAAKPLKWHKEECGNEFYMDQHSSQEGRQMGSKFGIN